MTDILALVCMLRKRLDFELQPYPRNHSLDNVRLVPVTGFVVDHGQVLFDAWAWEHAFDCRYTGRTSVIKVISHTR